MSGSPAGVAPVQLLLHSDDHQALAAAIDAWQSSLASPDTRRAYARAVRRVLAEYGQITPHTLAELRDDMADDGRRVATIKQAMTAVMSCVRWMVAGGFAPSEILGPLERVARPSGRDDRKPAAPTPDQVQAFVRLGPAHAYPTDPVRQAHAAVAVTLLAGTGIRVAEAAAACVGDLRDARPNRRLLAAAQGRASTKAAAVFQVVNGKGGVSRTIPAGEDVLRASARLWRVLGITPRPTDPLLPALDRVAGDARVARPLRATTTRSIRRTIEQLGAALEFERAIAHPHALRHAYAYAQLDPTQRPDGRPLSLGVLQDRLGHASADTTARYLRAGQDPDMP